MEFEDRGKKNGEESDKLKKQLKFDVLLGFWLAVYRNQGDMAEYFFSKEDILGRIIGNLRRQKRQLD